MNPWASNGLPFPLPQLPALNTAAGQSPSRNRALEIWNRDKTDENIVRRMWAHDNNGSTVMQPLPPTAQRIQERSGSSGGHSSYEEDRGSDKGGGSSNFRPDVGLSDEDLIVIETKDLNKILKKNNISKHRSQEIKQERRTLKNRGYASNCRVKREEEQDTLEDEIKKLKFEINRYNVPEMLKAIEFYEQEIKAMEKDRNLRRNPDHDLKQEMEDEELEAIEREKRREEYLHRQRFMNDKIMRAHKDDDDDDDEDEEDDNDENLKPEIKNEPDESIKVD